MSAAGEEAADGMMCCASCGKGEADEVKLKICTACKLVKYCSVECQKNHRPQHKKACKKRAAEIREDKLFKQPDESHLGECQICYLPLPLDPSKFSLNSCCCKRICDGCDYANKMREFEQGLEQRCPYCREPMPKTDEEVNQNYMKRVKANDPVALCEMGATCYREGDYEGAFEYYKKAAEVGDIEAHYQLGLGVEKDTKRSVYHLEEAAIGGHPLARCALGCEEMLNVIGGHPDARYNLAVYEKNAERFDRAMKHYIIAANLGYDDALAMVKKGFAAGSVSKEEFAAALRGHQAAVDATKSQKRTEAEAYFANNAGS